MKSFGKGLEIAGKNGYNISEEIIARAVIIKNPLKDAEIRRIFS